MFSAEACSFVTRCNGTLRCLSVIGRQVLHIKIRGVDCIELWHRDVRSGWYSFTSSARSLLLMIRFQNGAFSSLPMMFNFIFKLSWGVLVDKLKFKKILTQTQGVKISQCFRECYCFALTTRFPDSVFQRHSAWHVASFPSLCGPLASAPFSLSLFSASQTCALERIQGESEHELLGRTNVVTDLML